MRNVIIRSLVHGVFISVFFLACITAYAAESPYDLAWVRQLGTYNNDYGLSVALDDLGNAYISGQTQGSLGGTSAGDTDAFLAKYDFSGSLIWKRQLGTSAIDECWSIAVDGSGNAYIGGSTEGSLGGPQVGYYDAFLAKYDASGTLLWTRQQGIKNHYDFCLSVAVDGSGNAYITGFTEGSPTDGLDGFLTKYNASGTLLWTRQLGTTANDEARSVAIDGSGNAYITGFTEGSLGGPNAGGYDMFLAKYDGSGTLLWTRQRGTSTGDYSLSVATDGFGNAYISGFTRGSTSDSEDAFLAKYDPSGNLLWQRKLGVNNSTDESTSVAIDNWGRVYISGYTKGSLGGPNAGRADAFLAKYDTFGTLLWTRQIGTTRYDYSNSVAVDQAGNAYISGYTDGSLGGANAGGHDAFLAKYANPAPEPSTLALIVPALLGFAGIAARRMRRK